MKFSEVNEETWEELQPYFDTCVIPYTGLTGQESPWETTAALERLRDFMDLVEIPYKGRIVTYPAVQYGRKSVIPLLNDICHNVKSAGFTYTVIMTADIKLDQDDIPESALVLSLPRIVADDNVELPIAINTRINAMWKNEDLV